MKKQSQLSVFQRFTAMILTVFVLAGLFYSPVSSEAKTEASKKETEVKSESGIKYYSEVLKEWKEKGYVSPDTQAVLYDMTKAKNSEGIIEDTPFLWESNIDWVEWEVEIEKDGLYNADLTYRNPLGQLMAPQRKLEIDGVVPYEEAFSIVLYGDWQYETEIRANRFGDQVRPQQGEISTEKTVALIDSEGASAAPLMMYFTAGSHKIRFYYVDRDIELFSLTVKPAEALKTYDDYYNAVKSKGKAVSNSEAVFEAEKHIVKKSDSTISLEASSEPGLTPFSYKNKLLNTVGGWSWRNPNQSVTWAFEVEESGFYAITLKILQEFNDNLPLFQKIYINGEVLFQELECYAFPYSSKWQVHTLGKNPNEPFLFYLESGKKNTLTLETKLGEFNEIVEQAEKSSIALSNLVREVTMIIGSEPDTNYDYELAKQLPHLEAELKKIASDINASIQKLKAMSDGKASISNLFNSVEKQLLEMANDIDIIPSRISDLQNGVSVLGDMVVTLKRFPFAIDKFWVADSAKKIESPNGTVFQSIKAVIYEFIMSFFRNYDDVSGLAVDGEVEIEKTLEIWTTRSREWGELLKEFADSEFTPKFKTDIKLNILPAAQLSTGNLNVLMLSVASGTTPDISLSMAYNSPVEFAMRNTAADLSKMPEFDKVKSRFIPEMFVPYEYNGGVYAMPETMNFRVMFYRTDIFEELGLTPPKTWDEVYDKVLPTLNQNNLEMFVPAFYDMFITQNGGKFYQADGKSSALNSNEAHKGFKQMIELYNNYGLPINISFFNRFRTGETPIGIETLNTYLQIMVAAPEINGRWSIAQIPGTVKDGVANHSTGSMSAESAMIFENSKNQDVAWEFLKWWSSDDVQARFGVQLEALIGTESRWPTANLEAFKKLPWKKEHLDVISESWKWDAEIPVVPGGYYTARHMNNAWTRSIVGKMLPSDSLEICVEDINKELTRRQEAMGDAGN